MAAVPRPGRLQPLGPVLLWCPGTWFLARIFGSGIMYSTAISNVDLVVRQSTDKLWFASPGIRKLSNNEMR